MTKINFYQLATLPSSGLTPKSFYFIENGDYAEGYLTDDSGNAKMIGNSVMIQQIAGAGGNEVLLATDIAARDALTLTRNTLVLVQDASADGTVSSGSALYFYDNAGDTYYKVAEFESLDVQLTWANITGKPNSSPASIDQAVSDSHSHSNKAVLDGITASGSGAVITTTERNGLHSHANKPVLDKFAESDSVTATFGGQPIMRWEQSNW